MRVAPRPRAPAHALGLAVALPLALGGLTGCKDDNPPAGSISAPRSAPAPAAAPPKDSGKTPVSSKKGGDAKSGMGVKERLGIDR